MKSPFGWCLILAGLMANENGIAVAQINAPSFGLSDPITILEPETGFRFQADALAWTRNSPHNGSPVISGPESFSQNGIGNNGYVGGYRLGVGYLIDPNYEVEAVWTQFSNWNANGGGVLSHAIAFNGGQADPLVDPTGNANFINTGTYFRSLFDAASDTLGNPPLKNYAFLNPGSTYAMHTSSNLSDFQANFKTRRSESQRFSFGVGYRNIRLGDNAAVVVTGTFGTNDIPGGGTTNNNLTDQALTSHGLTLISGPADGFTNPGALPATTLAMAWNGTAQNQMNGLQGTMDATLAEWGIFTLEGLARAGLFYNQITGHVQEVYAASGADESVYGRTLIDKRDVLSFGGNLGLNGVFQLGSRVKLRTGYEAMVVTNTATAADQQQGLTYNSLGQASYAVKGGSTVILHGARIGLEFVW